MAKLEGIFLRQETEALSSTVAAKSNYFDNTDRKNNYSWSNTQSGEGVGGRGGGDPQCRASTKSKTSKKKCKACTFVNKRPTLIIH